jgi:hypothetical protein
MSNAILKTFGIAACIAAAAYFGATAFKMYRNSKNGDDCHWEHFVPTPDITTKQLAGVIYHTQGGSGGVGYVCVNAEHPIPAEFQPFFKGKEN